MEDSLRRRITAKVLPPPTPPVASADVKSKVEILFLFTHCLFLVCVCVCVCVFVLWWVLVPFLVLCEYLAEEEGADCFSSLCDCCQCCASSLRCHVLYF